MLPAQAWVPIYNGTAQSIPTLDHPRSTICDATNALTMARPPFNDIESLGLVAQ